MVSLSIWPRVMGDYASMVPIGSWVRLVHGSWGFFFFCHGSWLIWFMGFFWLWVMVHVFFLFGCGWWLQIEKWWKRKVVGLWLLWYVVMANGAMVEVIPLKQDDPNKTPTPMEL